MTDGFGYMVVVAPVENDYCHPMLGYISRRFGIFILFFVLEKEDTTTTTTHDVMHV